jgi:hypothetical protein
MAATKKKKITEPIEQEIQRLASTHGYDIEILRSFADFTLNPPKLVPKPHVKRLTLPQLKASVFKRFNVENLAELKKSGDFQMVTSGLKKLEASKKESWEMVYRKAIGIIPGEESETGEGCINGINIFNYDMPWKAFGLNPKINTTDDVKTAYRQLCQTYHPDKPTGNAAIFDRLTTFYKSLVETF